MDNIYYGAAFLIFCGGVLFGSISVRIHDIRRRRKCGFWEALMILDDFE